MPPASRPGSGPSSGSPDRALIGPDRKPMGESAKVNSGGEKTKTTKIRRRERERERKRRHQGRRDQRTTLQAATGSIPHTVHHGLLSVTASVQLTCLRSFPNGKVLVLLLLHHHHHHHRRYYRSCLFLSPFPNYFLQFLDFLALWRLDGLTMVSLAIPSGQWSSVDGQPGSVWERRFDAKPVW